MDNFQPILLNDSNNGKDWRVHGIKKSQVEKRQKNSQLGSKEIWEYTSELIEKNVFSNGKRYKSNHYQISR